MDAYSVVLIVLLVLALTGNEQAAIGLSLACVILLTLFLGTFAYFGIVGGLISPVQEAATALDFILALAGGYFLGHLIGKRMNQE